MMQRMIDVSEWMTVVNAKWKQVTFDIRRDDNDVCFVLNQNA
jgi:hypothetical protein